ncbi:MAG: dihydroorotate dehydrogenase electron transfer subunit [bacterium]|nr:dihydroorotate dehydrogenase electron transfer subunit [bacterium]
MSNDNVGLTRIEENIEVAENHFRMKLFAPGIARTARPGQFVHVRCSERLDPLLRRPFSLHRIREPHIDILYKIVGQGTELLVAKKAGEKLDVLGPLGNGFRVEQEKAGLSVLVGGGMGAAPLLALAEKLKNLRQEMLILIGADTERGLLALQEFSQSGELEVATVDGSQGYAGLVTDLLIKATANRQVAQVYACGPKAMLREVSRLAEAGNYPAQVSMEERMACGVGACLGCVVPVRSPVDRNQVSSRNPVSQDSKASDKEKAAYKRVCREGPVFEAGEIVW